MANAWTYHNELALAEEFVVEKPSEQIAILRLLLLLDLKYCIVTIDATECSIPTLPNEPLNKKRITCWQSKAIREPYRTMRTRRLTPQSSPQISISIGSMIIRMAAQPSVNAGSLTSLELSPTSTSTNPGLDLRVLSNLFHALAQATN